MLLNYKFFKNFQFLDNFWQIKNFVVKNYWGIRKFNFKAGRTSSICEYTGSYIFDSGEYLTGKFRLYRERSMRQREG